MECEPWLGNNDTSALGPLNLLETDNGDITGNAQVHNVSAEHESGNTQPQHDEVIHKSSRSEVRYEEITLNGHFSKSKTVVKMFNNQVTDKCKHFVRVCECLRCLFLVPMLESVDEPRAYFRVRSPLMLGGKVEFFLSRKMSNYRLDKRALVITTACQISEGIAFLHERNIVHGDINLDHILVDQYGIVRLINYGMYTHKSAESDVHCVRHAGTVTAVAGTVDPTVHFMTDLHSFVAVILQLVNPKDGITVAELLQNLPRMGTETWKEEYFSMWPADGSTDETIRFVSECLMCECSSAAATKLNENLNTIRQHYNPALELIPPVDVNDKEYHDCLYCSMQPVHPELWLRSTSCPEICKHLRACISCMVTFGSYSHVQNDVCEHRDSSNSGYVEHKCPTHGLTIEPVIGGERSFAVILHDTSNKNAENTKIDAVNMVKLASHPKVMRMPYKNVYVCKISTSVKPDDPKFLLLCQDLARKMKEILDGKPSYFLFYYSGHELVRKDNKSKPLRGIWQLVDTLRKFITEIAKKCPRILMIFDCCYAAAVAKLFDIELGNYSHVEWHVQWFSSFQKQLSNIEGSEMSAFTELVVAALKGGAKRQCPHETENCQICSTFRKSCRENGYVCLYDSAEFVRKHMHSRVPKNQESPSDVQTPGFRGTIIDKPVISFFNTDPTLYTFYFESTFDTTVHKFQTDDFHVSNIWHMTVPYRPKNAHHVKLSVRYTMQPLGHYYVDGTDMPSPGVNGILDALSKDNKCLLVNIDDMPVEVSSAT